MSIIGFEVSRNLPTSRISAYECQADAFGRLTKGKYVRGWYGQFTVMRLQSEIMPKLAEYAAQGWSYPFLVTSHELQRRTMAHIASAPKRRPKASGIKFLPRRRNSIETRLAVIGSSTSFELLS